MLTEICEYLRNWFDRGQPKFYGKFRIQNGEVSPYDGEDMGLQDGQYFRIIGSVFNDGVWKYGDNTNFEEMEDEEFEGSVWLMAVPRDLVSLVDDIKAWQVAYGAVDAPAMSPYNSESFGGYSYTKAYRSENSTGDSSSTWQGAFKNRLARWKKI